MNLASSLLDDYSYQQDKNGDYILNTDGWFTKSPMKDRVDIIKNYIGKLYRQRDSSIYGAGCLNTDVVGLSNVLHRYSRDVYGQKRLECQIGDLKISIPSSRKDKILDNIAEFGCKTSSSDPYFYRKIAYLFYWFSLIKPFHLDYSEVDIKRIHVFEKFYFNEYITYVLLQIVIKTYKENNRAFELKIHEDLKSFRNFLYDLHYRDLSRSSLEFFLQYHCKEIPRINGGT
ncbi:MAG: hypothetical protein LBG08_00485 [Spirochaetaceae bacterium]|nr:hypothetical protein [Spirochaetaceae bacterium]